MAWSRKPIIQGSQQSQWELARDFSDRGRSITKALRLEREGSIQGIANSSGCLKTEHEARDDKGEGIQEPDGEDPFTPC